MHFRTVFSGCLAALLTCSTLTAAAQPAFPNKPVRMIVPLPAGQATDMVARMLAEGLSRSWGHQVVVENRSGAGGNIGAEIAAKAVADGNTVLQISMTHALNVTLYKKLGYDLMRDFAPVTQIATSPSMNIKTFRRYNNGF